METEELLKFIRKLMDDIGEVGEQDEGIDIDMAWAQDNLLTDIYNNLEELQDKIDPSGEIRNHITQVLTATPEPSSQNAE